MNQDEPTLVDIKLNGAEIKGDHNSVVFTDFTDESQFELNWHEIWRACEDYNNKKEGG